MNIVAALASLLLGNPPLSIPAASSIMPKSITTALIACIPSSKVFAIPESEIATPKSPSIVNPKPGTRNSQSANSIILPEIL
jgi:hypothetical protein